MNETQVHKRRISVLEIALLTLIIIVMSIGTAFTLGMIEGKWTDPEGQLNNPFKLSCDQGLLADRTIPISDDGEYNWMFAKGQQVNITVTNLNNTTVKMFWIQWAFKGDNGVLDTNLINNETLFVSYNIATAGHYQLEVVAMNHTIVSWLQIQASASNTNTLLWHCLNIGDLFRSD